MQRIAWLVFHAERGLDLERSLREEEVGGEAERRSCWALNQPPPPSSVTPLLATLCAPPALMDFTSLRPSLGPQVLHWRATGAKSKG